MAELYRRGNRPQSRQDQNAYSYGGNDGYNTRQPSYTQAPPNNGYGDEKKYTRSRKSGWNFSFMSLFGTIALVSTSILCYGGMKLRYSSLNKKYNSSLEHQKKLYSEQHSKRVEVSRERSAVRKLEHDASALEKEYQELEQKYRNLKANTVHYGKENVKVIDALGKTTGTSVSETTGEVYSEEKMKQREDAWYHRIELLRKRIQRESQRQLIEMFGGDQMRVELKLFTKELQGDIVLEMAPTNLMPHSVHLFLKQVLHKLWDGTSFAINAPHIMQAGAYSPEGKSVRQNFKDAGLEVVAFQEYSPKFTHEQFHVGFAGRPGGPDIYINKMDNTINHGPGGQAHHHLEEEADPAFAKVVKGRDVLQKFFDMPAVGKNYLLKEYIIITQARVIFPEREPHAYDYKDYYDGFTEDDQYDLEEAYHEEYDSDDNDSSDDSHTHNLADKMRRVERNRKASPKPEENNQGTQYRQTRETTHHLDEMMD